MPLGFPLLFNHVQRKSYPVLLLMVADVSECVLPDTSKNVIFLLVALLYTLYNVKPNLCNPNRAISKSTLETVK